MRSILSLALFVAIIVGYASATIHFKETFDNDWESRWVVSKWKEDQGQAGKLVHTSGKWYGDANEKGIQTSQDARFYAATAKFPTFSNEGKDLVLQYTVKQENKVDCGGAYIKLMPEGVDQENFSGDSEYSIMFGPDVCGTSKRIHVIFNYKGKNHLIKKEIGKVETDQLTHQYTLILKPDNTYSVLVDNVEAQSGSLFEDWDMLPAKQIKDPKESKPADWVDTKEIEDPEDKKPEEWDSIPATSVDPEAVKPEDWNDEDDGEWEAPTIANPDYKGEWKAKKIANPEYKGEWVHPLIDNPEYSEDKSLYLFNKLSSVGFELWQVRSGSLFDNIIVTDSIEEARALSDKTFEANKDAEKKMFDEIEEIRVADEKKKMEEAKAEIPFSVPDDEDVEVEEEELVKETKKTETKAKSTKKEDHDEL